VPDSKDFRLIYTPDYADTLAVAQQWAAVSLLGHKTQRLVVGGNPAIVRGANPERRRDRHKGRRSAGRPPSKMEGQMLPNSPVTPLTFAVS